MVKPPFCIPWTRPSLGQLEYDAVAATMQSGWLSMGPRVAELEQRLAARVGRRFAIAVASGTAALEVCLRSLGLGPGDEVIVPALAYIAAPNAVSYQGARIMLADVHPATWSLDPLAVARQITPATRAILTLDYGGAPSNTPALAALARCHNLALIVDGAESLGARLGSAWSMQAGLVAITSFHMVKILSTIEGGMIFTDDPTLAEQARLLRSQGEHPTQKYVHLAVGHNYRMSDLHAAIGLAQLVGLEQRLAERTNLALRYYQRLAHLPLQLPILLPGATSSWFLFSVLTPYRDAIHAALAADGIETRLSWPLAVQHQPCYQHLAAQHPCPVAEQIAAQVLSLPLYPGMSLVEHEAVCVALERAIKA
ncbi:MAG: DegT/DnrJ/EryC1/StrS family aminotransferase [Oscillochloridaceae bacterium umkhey_bin13]